MRKRILFKDEEISREIERRISSEHLKEGSRLPSERQLAEEFGVQRDTVRCALEILLKKGLIVKRPRLGCFVAPKRLVFNANNFRAFQKEIETIGKNTRMVMLNFEKICMDKELSAVTHMPEETLCYHILRIRFEKEKRMSLERSYVIAANAPAMRREELEQKTLGALFKQEYGITLASVQSKITQVYADDMESELLRVNRNEPLLRYEGLIFDRNDRLIEYFDNVIIPDSIEFHIRDFA